MYFLSEGFELDFAPATKKTIKEEQRTRETELYKAYQDDPYGMLFTLGFSPLAKESSPSFSFLHFLAHTFVDALRKTPDLEFLRERALITANKEEKNACVKRKPFAIGMEFIYEDWIEAIFSSLTTVYQERIQHHQGTVKDFLLQQNPTLQLVGRVFFHLVETKDETYPFAFLATYSTEKTPDNRAVHTPLKNALLEYENNEDKLLALLSTVSAVAQKSDLISSFIESGEIFSPLRLEASEAYTFLQEISLYESAGILCRIPDWWKKRSHNLNLSVKVGDEKPSRLGIDGLLSFQPQLLLGEEAVTEEELQALRAQTRGLAFFKNKWVEVDPEKLEETLKALDMAREQLREGNHTLAEALRLQLNPREALALPKDVEIEVEQGAWLQGIMEKIQNPRLLTQKNPGEDFHAILRHYQQQGFDWLSLMQELGFGACLADDMGLGKTVQVIALLEYLRVKKVETPSLLIVPTSLLGNWQKELARFAPKLTVEIRHGAKKTVAETAKPHLIITTYGMITRNEALKSQTYELVILDEAQAIKNPQTKQTKSVKEIQGRCRIALTGTPIENSLFDLWSLFDFLNQGLLGSAKEFKSFVKDLNENPETYGKLRGVVGPFILRRLKTDKKVIKDLPDKVEIKTYARLSKKQLVLYQDLLAEIRQALEEAEGIKRKGLILSSILKFKQICNHPDHYLGQKGFSDKHSGKFELLQEIGQTIAQKRERVLVFTQFREMTDPLADFLATIFQRKGLVLHGGTTPNARTQLVDTFCGQDYVPFMVLSLKAGGVGLNLTAANHVIHFDRWWNPAVENQATDRAFRIGQEKTVMVHKFITSGTIEEKIDLLIDDKSNLAKEVLAGGKENWITELSNEELMDLFTLTKAGDSA